MIWLGERRGMLSDWVTQQWVRATGRHVRFSDEPWLDGPVGQTGLIGKQFFEDYAAKHNMEIVQEGSRGLLQNLDGLNGPITDASYVSRAVRDFYERTSEYELDAWAEWHSLYRPFGRALAVIFSRRLQQLNVPLSSLDSAAGMSSDVMVLRDRTSGEASQTAWVRVLHATHNVIYAGAYSVIRLPGFDGPCVKVVFPLPNGNAMVLMKPVVEADGSLSLISAGNTFGDPGFYFTVHKGDGTGWARYVHAMQETIHVYPAEGRSSRADHLLRFFGREFLRLHYRMRRTTES